jgi:hypothetical protein
MKRIPIESYLNKEFNFLTIITTGESKKRGAHFINFVDCRCVCGNIKNIALSKVLSGHTKSCGCIAMGKRKGYNIKHPTYKVWDAMIQRCSNPKNNSYNDYGGRGIIVCKEWVDSFGKFYDWVTISGYKKGLQIDRKDNNGNYEPSNCQWVTCKQNSRNRRNTILVYINGNRLVLAEAIELGLINKTKFYRNKEYKKIFIKEIAA